MLIRARSHSVSCLLVCTVLSASCAARVVRRETPRRPTAARPDVQRSVEAFKAQDPEASFTFFQGHVDSFATSAKATVPDYALATLKELGLSTTSRTPRKLAAPIEATKPRPSRDLDAESTMVLPFVPEAETRTEIQAPAELDPVDQSPSGKVPPREVRNQPRRDVDQMVTWERPDAATLAREAKAAMPILQAFLAKHTNVFGVTADDVGRILRPAGYQVGAYFRKGTYEQTYGEDERLLYGRTLVHFDVNWNVIGISRMIVTPAKLAMQTEARASARAADEASAVRIASGAFPDKACAGYAPRQLRVQRAVDAIRGRRVWDVELTSADGNCHWRTIVDRASGEVLNVSDLIDRFTDAQVNRWRFPAGDLFAPQQVVSTGVYTRNDRRLEHDFFYVMNDHRCEGDPEQACGETGFNSTWCARAHGTTNGSSFIRATRRSDRDFSSYFPGGASETFAETHTYFWARSFAQWLKPSLDAMGVLPGSASDYPRVLMITDACRSGSVHNASYAVTTDDDKGEGTNVIRLAHRNPGGSSNHNAACEGGGCFDNPSNIQHEMNHFFLKRYYDVGSDLDCGAANQLKFTHEGILGTAVPQAFWHNYYGVGYSPSSTNKLYFSHSNTGRVHTSNATRMTVGNFLCTANTDEPYRAGRVVGQALWEFYHGVMVSGSSTSGTWYPSTDTDFNWIVYWAADLQAASSYKDRYEFANRLMEILDKHSNWSTEGKQDYCAIFEHHELRNFIVDDYCQ
jgi:hypothetical protein